VRYVALAPLIPLGMWICWLGLLHDDMNGGALATIRTFVTMLVGAGMASGAFVGMIAK
jgi:hypothetical protein